MKLSKKLVPQEERILSLENKFINMRHLLQSFENSSYFMDIESMEIIHSNQPLPSIGWYNRINKEICCFYLIDNVFVLKYKDKEVFLDYFTKAILLKNDYSYKLIVLNKENVDLEVEYLFNKSQYIFELDTSAFVEEEDFNWGLFINNIINNKERQDRLKQIIESKLA